MLSSQHQTDDGKQDEQTNAKPIGKTKEVIRRFAKFMAFRGSWVLRRVHAASGWLLLHPSRIDSSFGKRISSWDRRPLRSRAYDSRTEHTVFHPARRVQLSARSRDGVRDGNLLWRILLTLLFGLVIVISGLRLNIPSESGMRTQQSRGAHLRPGLPLWLLYLGHPYDWGVLGCLVTRWRSRCPVWYQYMVSCL